MDQSSPLKYSHRMICKIVDSFHGGRPYSAQEYDRVGRVFVKSGGSWDRVLKGSTEDIRHLKKVVAIAVKNGYLGKTKESPRPDSEP